jgi:hypothetical protein
MSAGGKDCAAGDEQIRQAVDPSLTLGDARGFDVGFGFMKQWLIAVVVTAIMVVIGLIVIARWYQGSTKPSGPQTAAGPRAASSAHHQLFGEGGA